MKIAIPILIVAWVMGIAGCAEKESTIENPKGASVSACREVQTQVLAMDGRDPGDLLRGLMQISIGAGSGSVSEIESCLTRNLRVDCDPRTCRIREKYFVNN